MNLFVMTDLYCVAGGLFNKEESSKNQIYAMLNECERKDWGKEYKVPFLLLSSVIHLALVQLGTQFFDFPPH